jgi:transposase
VNAFYRLRTVPGIGKILALVLLYEIHDIHRFPRVQDFVSYCRLVKCAKRSDGKHYGYAGTKIGNAHLKWAFSEAAVLCLRKNPVAQRYVARLAHKHGKGKALTILAHKLGARGVLHAPPRAGLRGRQVLQWDRTRRWPRSPPDPPRHRRGRS